MVAKLISNLSVFIVWAGEKEPSSFGGRTDGQTDRQAEADRQAEVNGQTDEAA